MNDDAQTTIGRQPPPRKPGGESPPASGGVSNSPRGIRRRSGSRRLFAGGLLALLAGSVMAGSYYLRDRVEPETAEAKEQPELAAYHDHKAPILCLAAAADGETFLSGDKSGVAMVWNGTNRKARSTFQSHRGPVGCAALSADGALAATGDDEGNICIWNTRDGSLRKEFFAHGEGVTALAIYGTKQYVVSCGRDGRLALWNADEGILVRELRLDAGQFHDVALTPDNLRVVAGESSGAIRIINVTEFAELKRITAHSGGVTRVAVAPQGQQILSSGKDGIVRRWDFQTGRVLGEWKPRQTQRIGAITLSPGGTRASVVADGGQVSLWSTEDDRLIESYGGPEAPASCGQFGTGGTLFYAGSTDGTVRCYRLPPPTALELECMRSVAESNELLARKYERFGEHMKLGQSILDQRREKEALREFQAAEASLPADSLEAQKARTVVRKLSNNIEVLERYASLCKAGGQALDREDFAAAIVRFEEAQKLVRDLGLEGKYPEAREGLQTAKRADALKKALDGLTVVDKGVDFTAYFSKRPLDFGRQFAFLLTKETPPMALADTPLEWHVKLTTPMPFPDEKVTLIVELFVPGLTKPFARVDHKFIAGETEQAFLQRVAAPSGGWSAGTYELRTVLETPGGRIRPDGRQFKIGRLNWTEKLVQIKPEDVQRNHYVIDSGVKVAAGDALYLSAVGTTTPGPTAFYRDLLGDIRIAAPVPSEAEGLPWSKQAMRLQQYRTVDFKSNYAALLARIGYEGIWLPYKRGVPPLVMPTDGPLQLSINSILPQSFSYAKPPTTWSAADRSYWATDGGWYDVTILHGKYDFPVPISSVDKASLLLRYFGETGLPASR